MNEVPVQPGEVLAGKYHVERVLGAGGMGVVVAARHVALGRKVALKLMRPSSFAQPEARARFLLEARAPCRLRSQHVAEVFDVGALDSGAPYIVFEHLDGSDLSAVLQARGPLPVAEAVEYVLQACEAVAEAHAAGIIHRDLKPPNLFLTTQVDGSPCVKVLDFGISKDAAAAAELRVTRDQQGLGSPLYMSPEQMQSTRDVDAQTDIWSMGVVLYELVTGVTPFFAETLEQVIVRVLSGPPTPLDVARPGSPKGLQAVLFQCLERDRGRRWPNLAAFAAALAPFAPPRALPYVQRVAAVLRADVRASHPTVELPADALPPAPPVHDAGVAGVAETSAPAPPAATVTDATPLIRRVPTTMLLVLCVLVGLTAGLLWFQSRPARMEIAPGPGTLSVVAPAPGTQAVSEGGTAPPPTSAPEPEALPGVPPAANTATISAGVPGVPASEVPPPARPPTPPRRAPAPPPAPAAIPTTDPYQRK